MNEITKIHLGRQAFTIAVDAHKELQQYLRAIKQHMGDSDEAVEEVELRMAELLSERGVHGDKVVLLKDVEYLKQQLGEPGDFGDEEAETAGEDTTGPKRLFRDTENAMLAGVAAGIGKYIGVDPLWIRLAFIALVFAGASGILIYIILWLIVPEAKTSSERLQMQGKPVTVDALKDVVERADVKGAAERASSTVGKVVHGVLKVVLAVVGLGLMLTGIGTLLGLITVSIYWALNHDLVPGRLFPVGGGEVLLLILGLVVLGMVGLFFAVAGEAAIKRKWPLPAWALGAMVVVFLASLAVGGALAADAAPKLRDRYEAAQQVYSRSIPEFTKLRIIGSFDVGVRYEQSPNRAILIKHWGDEIDFSDVAADVQDQTLTVDARTLSDRMRCKALCLFRPPIEEVIIQGPMLQEVATDMDGAELELANVHDQTIRVRASLSPVHLTDVRADKVKVVRSVDGFWNLTLSGTYQSVEQPQDILVSLNTMNISAKNIDLTFEGECSAMYGEPSSGPGIVVNGFDSLTVNGQKFASVAELHEALDKPGSSSQRCVTPGYPSDSL